ncbi:hypothetical protein KFZ68_16005 [Photobacterium damselae]|uniref:hypothetical protein n=1 Tax=Photobacterium damselae TaxID=38293 RepID=UPI0025439AD5
MKTFRLRISHGLSMFPDITKNTTDPDKALNFLKYETSPYSRGYSKSIEVDGKVYVKNIAINDAKVFKEDYICHEESVDFSQRIWRMILLKL